MAVCNAHTQRASRPAATDLNTELSRITSLTIDQLRVEWRELIGLDPPPAFSKDLIARALCHRLQEQALGGLSPRMRKAVGAIGKGDQGLEQRIKPGSLLVREYEGKLHEVRVAPDGFSWQGETYASLSTIARKITGTKWNGPRFFGLRDDRANEAGAGKTSSSASATDQKSRKCPPAGSSSPNAFLRVAQ